MSFIKGVEIPNRKLNISVLKLLLEALQQNGDDTALIEGETGKTASYAEILQQGRSIAAGLCSRGVTAEDVLVVCCEKSILAYSLLLGAMLSGATVPLVPTSCADMIPELTKGHPVKAILCDVECLDSVKSSVERLSPQPSLVFTTDPRDPVTSYLLDNSDLFSECEVKDIRKRVGIILYSSGTTGVPKGVEVTDYSLQPSSRGSDAIKSFLSTSRLYWTSGLYSWIGGIFNKHLVIMSNSRDTKVNLMLAEKYKVQAMFINTGARYTYEFEKNPVDLSSVKRVFAGGETILEHEIKEFVSKVFDGRLNVETMYGSSEAGVLTFNWDKNNSLVDEYKVLSSGKVLPGSQVKIIGEDGDIVPLGCLGELWVKSMNMTTGYWNKPELNSQLFDKEGFLKTGDLGHFDQDGNLFCLGRIDDMVNYKGHKVWWTQVENLVMSHPAVLEAAVVGTPHPQDHQHLTAFVVRKSANDNITENDIQTYVNDQVGDIQKLRGGVHFLETLPRTAIGKVIRSKLRKLTL